MALTDLLADIYATFTFTQAHAEAEPEEQPDEEAETEDSSEGKGDEEGEEKEEEGEGEGGKEEEEEEEEEDEPEDLKPKLEEECSRSAQCAPLKHHYDACAARVTAQHANPNHHGPKEDCVEEFFHLSHCASQCAAPKLFRALK